jgi:tetratricopeptide (TPR) repeat protein
MNIPKRARTPLTIAATLFYVLNAAGCGYAQPTQKTEQKGSRLEETVSSAHSGLKEPDSRLYELIETLDYERLIKLVDENRYAGEVGPYKERLDQIAQYDLSSVKKKDRHKVAQVYNSIGAINFVEKNYEEAVEFYTKAVEMDDSYALFYRNLGLAYKELGKQEKNRQYLEKALEYYDRCLELEPENSSRAQRVKRVIEVINTKYLPQFDK